MKGEGIVEHILYAIDNYPEAILIILGLLIFFTLLARAFKELPQESDPDYSFAAPEALPDSTFERCMKCPDLHNHDPLPACAYCGEKRIDMSLPKIHEQLNIVRTGRPKRAKSCSMLSI